jgi:hypothetical protein
VSTKNKKLTRSKNGHKINSKNKEKIIKISW